MVIYVFLSRHRESDASKCNGSEATGIKSLIFDGVYPCLFAAQRETDSDSGKLSRLEIILAIELVVSSDLYLI